MAENLGEAQLRLTVDLSAFEASLQKAKSLIDKELGDATARPSSRRSSRSGTIGGARTPVGDLGRQVQAARDLNLNTNWGVALRTLGEIDNDLALIGASKALNLRQGWQVALQQLLDIDQDLESIASGKALNIQSSWNKALSQLADIDTDLKQIASGTQLNLKASWNTALSQLSEINTDLKAIAAGSALNLNNSWTAALSDLQQINADLQLISSGKELNLRTSWGAFLQQLQTTKADIDAASRQGANAQTKAAIRSRIEQNRKIGDGFGAASRDNFGVTPQTRRDQLEADLARVVERRTAVESRIAKTAQDLAAANERESAAARKAATAREQAISRRVGDAIGSGIIGGAFPALFGQGAGASVGGGLGGLAGGALGGQFGFGLSLVGTAIGQRFDDVSKALQDPIKNFDALQTAGLLSSKALEKNVQALIEVGRVGEAAALIQADLAKFGDTSDIRKLQEATDSLNRAFSEASLIVGTFVAGPLADFLEKLRKYGNPDNPDIPGNRQRLTNNSNAMQDAGFTLTAAGGIAAATGLGAPLSVGLLATGATLVGVGEATKPPQIDPKQQAAATAEQQKQIQKASQLRALYGELNTLAFRQTAAQVQGNKELELRTERLSVQKQLELDTSKLKNTPEDQIRRQAVTDKAKQDIFALDEQLKSLTNGSLTTLQNRLTTLNNERLRVPVDSAEFAELGLEIETLGQKIKQLQNTPLRLDSVAGLQQQLSDLEARQTKLSVDSTAFTEANKKILETQNALEQLNGKKALITVEQINAGVQNGTLTNNFSNLEKRSQAAKQALNTAAFGSPEYYQAARASQEANFELGLRQRAADPSAIKQAVADQQAAAEGVRSAFKNVEQAADGVTQAHRAYRSALEASFDLLTQEKQAQILGNAREDLRRAVDSGLFKRDVLALEGKDLVSAAQQARGIFNAEEDIGRANARLADANEALRKSVEDLNKKNWDVKVLVDAATGNYTTNLG